MIGWIQLLLNRHVGIIRSPANSLFTGRVESVDAILVAIANALWVISNRRSLTWLEKLEDEKHEAENNDN